MCGTIRHSSCRLFLGEYSFQSTIDKFQRTKTIFHSSQHCDCVNFLLVTSKHSQNLTPAHSRHSGPGPSHHHHLVPVLPPPSSRSPCFCRGLLTLTVNTGATGWLQVLSTQNPPMICYLRPLQRPPVSAPATLFSEPTGTLLPQAFGLAEPPPPTALVPQVPWLGPVPPLGKQTTFSARPFLTNPFKTALPFLCHQYSLFPFSS